MKNYTSIDNLITELKQIQDDFLKHHGVSDIISNSKIFEILIANGLDHALIPGHSGSRDSKDKEGKEYEYKHYKESSSNHSWTFNDFTDSTINRLKSISGVIFAHINDEGLMPAFDWYYNVPGIVIANYLENRTIHIENKRKMINVSPRQIETDLRIEKSQNNKLLKSGRYYKWLKQIFTISRIIERRTGTKGILTSNKFWELLVAQKLGHKVLSEQATHDAIDKKGNYYEYKVAKNYSWNFQDISPRVLKKYKSDSGIVLGVVDKDQIKIQKIYIAKPNNVIRVLRQKLKRKAERFEEQGKEIRRLQVSLSKGELKLIKAKLLYPV